ncbi:hypothetical protein [Altererythrobacter sp. GH1-8]|uniref:hypothetical protein n=1 Tax=Altererythrobacter sp. GH1-8 TaxID=3349333 RepID=UPI00374D3570
MLDWFGVALGRDTAAAVLARRMLFVLPFILVIILVEVKINRPWTYWHVAGIEDGPIEWLTAIIYMVAALWAGKLAWRFHRTGLAVHAVLSAILALGMFVIGMEEISWGQRVFGIASPEFFVTANRQQELNLHNLGHNKAFLDAAYLVVTFYAMTARLWVPRLLAAFQNGRFASLGRLVSPPAFLLPYFLVPFLLYLYYVNVPFLKEAFGEHWGYGYIPEQGYFMISRDQEPAECILALGFLFFSMWLLAQQYFGAWSSAKNSLPSAESLTQHRYYKG